MIPVPLLVTVAALAVELSIAYGADELVELEYTETVPGPAAVGPADKVELLSGYGAVLEVEDFGLDSVVRAPEAKPVPDGPADEVKFLIGYGALLDDALLELTPVVKVIAGMPVPVANAIDDELPIGYGALEDGEVLVNGFV